MVLALNRSVFTGRITHNLKLDVYQTTKVCHLQVAVDSSYRKKNDMGGSDKFISVDRTEFVPCEIFGDKAERLAQFNPKGKLLYFEGRLKVDRFTPKGATEEVERMVIELHRWQFVEKKDKDDAGDTSTDEPEGG